MIPESTQGFLAAHNNTRIAASEASRTAYCTFHELLSSSFARSSSLIDGTGLAVVFLGATTCHFVRKFKERSVIGIMCNTVLTLRTEGG